MRLFVVSMICALLDLMAFLVLIRIGIDPMKAHVLSFVCSNLLYFVCLVTGCLGRIDTTVNSNTSSQQLTVFLLLRILTLSLRGGIFVVAMTTLNLPVALSGASVVLASAAIGLLGDTLFLWPTISVERRKLFAAVGIIIYLLSLRLVFLGFANLLPEEAYYWNYAQHLDIGYLDHPPMVAWLIWLGTTLFGDNEFGVRIGAYICWLLTAGFSFYLARNLFDKATAIACALLVAVLPFYFSTGFLMMPDAPLAAAWVATLYFLERALIGEKRLAWLGAGLSFGIGLLSKYTILLLGPAALLLILIDHRSRQWLGRKEPYLGAAISILFFSPVLYWNATHQWMSFAFQGSRRVDEAFQFTLPSLIVSVAVLLTPTGFIATAASLKANLAAARSRPATARVLFILLFTLIPLSIFVLFSLFHENKPNWTGPLWLAVLPFVASMLIGATGKDTWLEKRLRRAWIPTIGITTAVYALLFHYVVLGFPGIGYIHNIRTLPVAWSEFGQAVNAVEAAAAKESAAPVVLIGMDKYFLASELAFYGRQAQGIRANSVGLSAIGGSSLMYDVWYPAETLLGSTAVLVSLKRSELQQDDLPQYFSSLSNIQEQVVRKNGAIVGSFYYRIGYNLSGCESAGGRCTSSSGS
ncbi:MULTISPECIES: glycosyltransferase family 39 protein [unclassified Rhizobium]|uniref:glycosyltransferase family 39 protein n=1 Tax=unclassified Rhizobium TaxID=2613769 RepID=UPI001612E064|nr:MULTISPECIES: glycosyltransferase family 39 protein [unclassified Rhizobium]MBB3386633.1 dolichol-phosphate mannosyltransferase [Rhizobium sp. BK098]MBB3618337.1 dolichol-phosphate mannosyltransferase [Rhizobium sp. BK609]MBB3683994.1 dolichol-phosphate mannosyltransferase [Rhizobium sp. BK612]